MTTLTHTTQTDFYRDIKSLLHYEFSAASLRVLYSVITSIFSVIASLALSLRAQRSNLEIATASSLAMTNKKGQARAQYGAMLIKNLLDELIKEFGKGFKVNNLKNMRCFYLAYSNSETPSRNFTRSWSHYIFLTRISNLRHF